MKHIEDTIFNPRFWDASQFAADFRWDEMEWDKLDYSS